ncbi:MAG: hypothetical protein ACK5LR_06190 [Mangrovibacterium sp.]
MNLSVKNFGIVCLGAVCFLTSCATLLNERTTYVTVKTTEPAMIICGSDSIETGRKKTVLKLERSSDPITISAISDSLKSQVTLEAQNSKIYKYNIFNLGLGMLVDKDSPKRYEYPTVVKINLHDSIPRVYNPHAIPPQGSLLLHVSLPHVNSFYFQPADEGKKYSTGFLGFSAGLDYYYKENSFVNLSRSAMTNFPLPFPAPIDYDGGVHERFNLMDWSLSCNRKHGRWSCGYGVSWSEKTWRQQDFEETGNDMTKKYATIGFVFPAYYQFGKAFHLGLIYRPSFYQFGEHGGFNYEHSISIDFAWKIKLFSR